MSFTRIIYGYPRHNYTDYKIYKYQYIHACGIGDDLGNIGMSDVEDIIADPKYYVLCEGGEQGTCINNLGIGKRYG